jgi:hypothetical protein
VFTILQPCTQRRWDQLPGDGATRFCDACGESVHRVSPENAAEIRRRVEAGEKVCGFLPPPPPKRRSLLRTALVLCAQPLFGGSGQLKVKVVEHPDSSREGARVIVSNRKTSFEAISGPDGIALFPKLPGGDYVARASLGKDLATFGDACVYVGSGTAQVTLFLLSSAVVGTIIACRPTPAWRRWLHALIGR